MSNIKIPFDICIGKNIHIFAFEKSGLTLYLKKVIEVKQIQRYLFLHIENRVTHHQQADRLAPRQIIANVVSSFLCIVGFYFCFILRFAEHSLTLRKSSLSESEFIGTQVHDKVFTYIMIATAPSTMSKCINNMPEVCKQKIPQRNFLEYQYNNTLTLQ